MKVRAAVGALALSLLTFAGASAQQLETGKWTGKLIVPMENAPQIDLNFDVKNDEGKLSIAMSFVQAPMTFDLSEIKLEENKLSFSFAPPNTVVRCDLSLQEDRTYAGECVEDNDPTRVRLVMTPPKPADG